MASPFQIRFICGNRLGFAVQLIVKACKSLAKRIGLESCQAMISAYVLFKDSRRTFTVLAGSDSGFAPTTQSDIFRGNREAAMGLKHADRTAWKRTKEQDIAFREFTAMFLHNLKELSTHEYLYECTEDTEWEFVKKYKCQK